MSNMLSSWDRFGEVLMGMTDETWKRHANPWSVWTRVSTLPILLIALYSGHWIGWWSLLPIIIVCAWIWINPRAFPPPRYTDNWGSKGTFGERVWLNRDKIPIPRHHEIAANILAAVSMLGVVFCGFGLWVANGWAVALGGALIYLGKMWFVDRMVWLYEDMKDSDSEYAGWLVSKESPEAKRRD